MLKISSLTEAPEHLQTLACWHHRQWSHLYPGQTLEQRIDNMQDYLQDDFIPSTFIARDGENLVGSAAIISSDMETRPRLTPWLASVYVHEPCRRTGIGSTLVRYTCRQAVAHGIDRLYLFTPDMEAFYRQLGWSVVDRERYHGEIVTIMSTRLIAEDAS